MAKERGEEAVDAGAAIARGKATSLLAEPLFCTSADARFADKPASNCEASVEAEEAARADGVKEDGRDNEADDGPRSGMREGATVRRMVSSVVTRS